MEARAKTGTCRHLNCGQFRDNELRQNIRDSRATCIWYFIRAPGVTRTDDAIAFFNDWSWKQSREEGINRITWVTSQHVINMLDKMRPAAR